MQMSWYNFSKTSGLHLKMALKTAELIWLAQSRILLKWNLYLPATLSSPASTLMYWKSSSDMSSLTSDPRTTLARVSSSSEEAEALSLVFESLLSSEDFELESDDFDDELALDTLGDDFDFIDDVPDEVSAPKNDSKDKTDKVSEESLS